MIWIISALCAILGTLIPMIGPASLAALLCCVRTMHSNSRAVRQTAVAHNMALTWRTAWQQSHGRVACARVIAAATHTGVMPAGP